MTTPTTALSPLAKSQPAIESFFEVTDGARKQKVVVRKNRIVLGSIVSADVKLVGLNVAPIHAVIEVSLGETLQTSHAKILDLASPSGVWVNGAKVVQAHLKNGDQIKIGEITVKFGFQEPSAEAILPDQALLLIDEREVTPIFDYRPEVKDSLEVAYSWNDTILDVEHFTDAKAGAVPLEVHLGESKDDDFIVPP